VGAHPEAECGDDHDRDFNQLPEDERVALAEPVRVVAGEGDEHGPWGVKKDGHQSDRPGRRQRLAIDGEEHRRGVDRLVVEGREELGDQ
jgi:hypothetical protein